MLLTTGLLAVAVAVAMAVTVSDRDRYWGSQHDGHSYGVYFGGGKTVGDLTFGTKSDWFLPSKDELNQSYLQKATVGGFAAGNYWSSSQDSDFANSAWVQYFVGGAQGTDSKIFSSYCVRPVRAFSN